MNDGMTISSLLNAGIPVITSNVGPFAYLPDDCCWKVDVGEVETDLLLAYLRHLCAHPELRRQMGANALRYIRATIPTYEQAAERVVEFTRSAYESQRTLLGRVQRPEEILARTPFSSAGPAVTQARRFPWRRLGTRAKGHRR